MSPELNLVDLLLGEGSEEGRNYLRRAVARDPSLALELAETAQLLESCRSLTVEPTGRVLPALTIRARIHLHRRETPQPQFSLVGRLLGIGAVAALALASLLLDPLGIGNRAPTQAPEMSRNDDAPQAPERAQHTGIPLDDVPIHELASSGFEERDPILRVDGPLFNSVFDQLSSLAAPDALDAWVSASNALALLGVEFRRSPSDQRPKWIEATGGNPDVDARVRELARVVAEQIPRELARAEADVLDTSLALRALLASGSHLGIGHSDAVRLCSDWLVQRLETMDGGELASALIALSELATPGRGRIDDLVREHTGRLVAETLTRPEQGGHDRRPGRPSLLSFDVPVASLADAGRLFYLAPAFLVPSDLAFEARKMVLIHLEDRVRTFGKPGALAAELYGFGDMIGRDDLDRRLKMWRTTNLDYVTIYHLAWSRFPVRPGWASFQRDLRRLSARSNPDEAGQAGALLLCLSMNFAAPGSAEMLLEQD